MDIENLKEIILENDYIPTILEELGCHHITHKGEYYSCGNVDGDNPSAICVYENTNLTTIDFTRDIAKGKNIATDIISLVEYFKQETFPKAIKWICDVCDLDYYTDVEEDIPESLKITKMLIEMQMTDEIKEEEKPLKPIAEHILDYYKPYVNDMFKDDGVSYETQVEFEIGYDESSNRITIPIRDELANLVGVKGRYYYREVPESEQKFIYLERCARSQILYGLYKTMEYIQQRGRVFVVEAEKGVQQLYDKDYKECVATGGKKITNCQINKLTRLCVPIYFVFDKDVDIEELRGIADRFIDGVEIYAIIDKNGLLEEKESPTDNIDKFEKLLKEKENIIKLK